MKSNSTTLLALACASLLTLGPFGLQAADSTPASAPPTLPTQRQPPPAKAPWNMKDKVVKTEAEWKQQLTPDQFQVLRKEATEPAFTGSYWDNHRQGLYHCAGCDLPLFKSDHKFDSGTGWPSFYQPTLAGHIGIREDRKFFMRRTEVHCARCGGHLGHVFNDGPKPTGLRYCINSASLEFKESTVP